MTCLGPTVKSELHWALHPVRTIPEGLLEATMNLAP